MTGFNFTSTKDLETTGINIVVYGKSGTGKTSLAKTKDKLIIIVRGNLPKKEHIKEAKKNKVNIIKTNMNTFETSRVILNSNYIKKIIDITN